MLINLYPDCNKRLILRVAGLSSSTYYDKRQKVKGKRRPGPKPKYSDQRVLQELVDYLKAPIFYLEGYKKIHKRLTKRGITVAKERLRAIMSKADLLCHQNKRNHVKTGEHNGTITTNRQNELWGMDIKEFRTSIGKIYFMGVIDHYNSEMKGWYIDIKHTRLEVMHALRNAVRNEFKSVAKDVCKDSQLSIRVDHGSEFDSKEYDRELLFLGIHKSSAYIRSPQCNGVIERFHRTLKEQLIDIHSVEDIDRAREKVNTFIKQYNEYWMLHRLGLQSPLEYKSNKIPSGNQELEGVCP